METKEVKVKSAKKNQNILVETSEYKGHPVIALKRDVDDKFPFSFGLSKAKLVIQHLEAIKAFVAANAEQEGEGK